MKFEVYEIDPVTKPRMTQRDKWQERPCVMRYRAFKDRVRSLKIDLPESGFHILFVVPMPASWSKKKKAKYLNQKHQNKPDSDNLTKALFDAVFKDDQHIWDYRATKMWGNAGKIIIITGIPTDWIKTFLSDVL